MMGENSRHLMLHFVESIIFEDDICKNLPALLGFCNLGKYAALSLYENCAEKTICNFLATYLIELVHYSPYKCNKQL